MTNRVSIDFGTTRTKVAYRIHGREPELLRFGGHRYLPYAASLFYLPGDDGPILFGDEAERMQERDPAGVIDVPKRGRHNEIVRAGDGRSARFTDLLTVLFTQLRAKAAREIPAFGREPPLGVNLTIPVGFGPVERELWEQGARNAGFADVLMLDEPSAAALGWAAAGGSLDEGVIVLDCGGGTVDWAWLGTDSQGKPSFGIIPPEGIVDLGGHDIDLGLLELVEASLIARGIESLEFGSSRRTRLLKSLRGIKEAISCGDEPEPLTIENVEVLLTRDQILGETRSRFAANMIAAFSRFLARVGATNNGKLPAVLLVGGGSRIGGIRNAIESAGAEVIDWNGSEFAVALGAATLNPTMTEAAERADACNPSEQGSQQSGPSEAVNITAVSDSFEPDKWDQLSMSHDMKTEGDFDMAMEISENNLNNDLVAALLDRVMIPYSINEDGRFSIVDQFEIYAVVKEDHIILYDIYSFKDSTDQSTRMKVANDINDNLRLVRAAATDAGTVVLDYEVIVIGGISPQAVITSIRKFQTLVSSALGRYAREYLK